MSVRALLFRRRRVRFWLPAPSLPSVPPFRAGRGRSADSGQAPPAAGVPAIEQDHGGASFDADQAQADRLHRPLRTMVHNEDGKPKASVFFIAYTKDQEDPTTRPVTFFFNGGPGPASIWLDMSSQPDAPGDGPRRRPAPPYNLVENPESPLDIDLVQIDAMMTGYSRPPEASRRRISPATATTSRCSRRLIKYLDKYNRWQSPKYLFGESYGTYSGLASELQTSKGIELNGIMLLGTVLDFQFISPSPNEQQSATRAFLRRTPQPRGTTRSFPPTCNARLEQVVRLSRKYAFGGVVHRDGTGEYANEQRTAMTARSPSTAVCAEHQSSHRPRYLSDRTAAGCAADLGRYDSRMLGLNGNASIARQDYE